MWRLTWTSLFLRTKRLLLFHVSYAGYDLQSCLSTKGTVMSDQYCYDVFLSHCSADDAVAQDLCERLTDDGLRVFIDHRDIAPGEDFNLKIEFGLDNSRVLVVLMSTHMRDSQWVGREFVSSTADDPRNRSRRVVPLRLDDSAAPFGLKLLQDIDWRATCR